MIMWIEPGSDGTTPVQRSMSESEAIKASRASWARNRPDSPDSRSNEEALMGCIVVNWANRTDEESK